MLEKLIAKLCPDGVEYKQLGELGEFYSGLSGKSKDDFVDGNTRFISYMNVFSNLSTRTDIQDRVRVSDSEKQNVVEYGDALFTGSSETKEECGMASVMTHRPCEKIYLNSFCFGFRLKDKQVFEPDFMKHLLRSFNIRKQISNTASGVTRFNVSKVRMAKVCLPIPPLPVQKEIVRMLDEMTGLIDALEEELAARKKQYEWCRERLLTFGDDVEYKPLGEFCSYVRGVTYSKEQEAGSQIDSRGLLRANNIELTSSRLLLEDVKYIKSTVKINSMQWLKKGDILICAGSGSREHIGKVAFIEHDMDFVFGGFMAAIRCKEKLVSKFLFHVLRSVPFKNHLGLVLNSSTINNLKS